MAHGNDIVHKNHFRKHWQGMVKTWFNQPARKHRRAEARKAKAKRVAPKPACGPLRPIVNCPTRRYNMKVRAGRGFTLQELKAVGLSVPIARSIGIAVDHRRRNLSMEGLNRNAARLRHYMGKVILFNKAKILPVPCHIGELQKTKQRNALPGIHQKYVFEKARKITDDDKNYSAFHAIRQHRANKRLAGKRMKARAAKVAERQEVISCLRIPVFVNPNSGVRDIPDTPDLLASIALIDKTREGSTPSRNFTYRNPL
ncbi:60S ribosomal protein L13 [Hymenolepis weldensis]